MPAVIDYDIPTGSIIHFSGPTAPKGFVFCNGQALSTTTHAALFNVIQYTYGGSGGSFLVPNTQERYIRGKDASRALGSVQGQDTGSGYYSSIGLSSISTAHNHRVLLYADEVSSSGTSTVTSDNDTANPNYWPTDTSDANYDGRHSHTVNQGGDSETAPITAYMNFIIKL